MQKIKTFKFEVSNPAYKNTSKDDKHIIERYESNLSDTEEIDAEINAWIEAIHGKGTYQLISITPVTYENHNNARANWIELYYTFMYEE